MKCLRCQEEKAKLTKSPYPGKLGEKIQEAICNECWLAWQKFSVNVINDYRLRPFMPEDRATLESHMKKFLGFEPQTAGAPSAATITMSGQGKAVTFDTTAAPATTSTPGAAVLNLETIIDRLKQVFDPEVPVNIYDLGLIYGVEFTGSQVKIKMTLTSQHCPAAKSLPDSVRDILKRTPGITDSVVDIVWDPPWSKERMTDDGKDIMGV